MFDEDDYKLNDNVDERRGRGVPVSVNKSTSHLTIFLKSISHMHIVHPCEKGGVALIYFIFKNKRKCVITKRSIVSKPIITKPLWRVQKS